MLTKRSFTLSGHRTSVALEDAFWDVLEAAAAGRGLTLAGLVGTIDGTREPARSLASALRLHALSEVLANRNTS
jgi:predicted DNA-binding ribbon-helix-helix protein